MTDLPTLFHHAVPVADLAETRRFYGELLGCALGPPDPDDRRLDCRFFGHHLVAHRVSGADAELQRRASAGAAVAVRHFGVVLPWAEWEALAARLRERAASFLVEPQIRHAGTPREEAIAFLRDPAGNGIELKAFRDPAFLFRGA